MAYHIEDKNSHKCNVASLELETLKNNYENATKEAEAAKQMFLRRALDMDDRNGIAATNAKLVDEVLPTLRGGLQSKEVAPADIEQVVTPDDGYLGLQRVKVAPYEREVQVVNRRANESEYLYYMEDIATQYQRSDYAVCMAGEFYKNADTTILAGADAYLTSDGDFYTAQTTHTWHDDDDMHANRWVVYYFKEGENKSNFMIADASACPTVLAVKGHLGAIIANIQTPIRDIIIFDGSSVLDIRLLERSEMLPRSVVIGDVLEHTANYIFKGNGAYIKYAVINVKNVSATTFITDCANIISLYLPNLEELAASLPAMTYLSTLYIPVLKTARILLPSSNNVTILDAPELEYASYHCVYGNSLKKIHMPAFKGVLRTGNDNFNDIFIHIDNIEELELPSLVSFNTQYHCYMIRGAAKLKRLILPKYNAFVGEYPTIRGGNVSSVMAECPLLEYVYMPESDCVEYAKFNGYEFKNLHNLSTVILGRISNVIDGNGAYYDGYFENCPRLIHLEARKKMQTGVYIYNWAPTEALNENTDLIEDTDRCTTNREQFFVNFVEYILHRLQNRTSTSKLTIQLSATVYDAIFSDESGFEYEGQPIGDYVTSYIAGINWSVAKA